MSIDRIGGNTRITRDTTSAGHELVDRAQQNEMKPARNEKVDEVAKLYEKQFLREMVKAMRGTVDPSGLTKPSMAENIYRDQLDNEYVEVWGDKGGIGLSELIYDQIMSRYFGEGGGLKQGGPIALTDRDVSRVVRAKQSQVPGQVPLKVEVKPSAEGTPAKVQAPWSGEVISNARIGGQAAVTLDHGQGLKSTVVFEGVAAGEVQKGQRVEKGETVGVMSPEASSFNWNIQKPKG